MSGVVREDTREPRQDKPKRDVAKAAPRFFVGCEPNNYFASSNFAVQSAKNNGIFSIAPSRFKLFIE